MSEVKVNKISPRSGTDVTLGDSGDTFTIPSGATITNNGTANGFGSADTEKVKVSSNDTTAGFLNGKLVAGTNITLTEGSDGGDETLTAAFSGNLNASVINAGTLADARIPNLNASKITAGTIATARLGSGTASSSTFLRGDQTYAEAGGGKILQVLSSTKTARQSITSTSGVDISNMSVTITPSATSSKIFITAFFGAVGYNGYESYANLVRGSTDILLGDSAGSTQRCTMTFTGANSGGTTTSAGGFAMSFLDSPSTTSSTTYKMQGFVRSGGTFEIGGTQNTTLSYFASGPCTFTVMEVGA